MQEKYINAIKTLQLGENSCIKIELYHQLGLLDFNQSVVLK